MAIGMKLHHFAHPKPPSPAFKIKIPSRLSPHPGSFKLVFYVPESYYEDDGRHYPVVVNFHGGGFTLGTGTDDARWADAVVSTAEAILVSVEYRLAPEYPFSTGVEDCTDALIYLAAHAQSLRIDAARIALSGFSAGGNYALTAPLVLWDLQQNNGRRTLAQVDTRASVNSKPGSSSGAGEKGHAAPTLVAASGVASAPGSANSSQVHLKALEPTELEIHQALPELTIKCIISFYPPTDFRQTRAEKRLTNPKQEFNLPPTLTDLFDESYLNSNIDLADPYLSPAAADDQLLKDAYPESVILYTCEYDMLNVEGVAFGDRLRTLGLNVKGGLIREVPHAFDKKPNPLRFPKAADRCYEEACSELRVVFGKKASIEERTQLSSHKPVERFEEGHVSSQLTEEGGELAAKVNSASDAASDPMMPSSNKGKAVDPMMPTSNKGKAVEI